jgi:hypothetical protein
MNETQMLRVGQSKPHSIIQAVIVGIRSRFFVLDGRGGIRDLFRDRQSGPLDMSRMKAVPSNPFAPTSLKAGTT